MVDRVGDEVAVALELVTLLRAKPASGAGSTYALITRFESRFKSSR